MLMFNGSPGPVERGVSSESLGFFFLRDPRVWLTGDLLGFLVGGLRPVRLGVRKAALLFVC